MRHYYTAAHATIIEMCKTNLPSMSRSLRQPQHSTQHDLLRSHECHSTPNMQHAINSSNKPTSTRPQNSLRNWPVTNVHGTTVYEILKEKNSTMVTFAPIDRPQDDIMVNVTQGNTSNILRMQKGIVATLLRNIDSMKKKVLKAERAIRFRPLHKRR